MVTLPFRNAGVSPALFRFAAAPTTRHKKSVVVLSGDRPFLLLPVVWDGRLAVEGSQRHIVGTANLASVSAVTHVRLSALPHPRAATI
jgi:hypothetical protein